MAIIRHRMAQPHAMLSASTSFRGAYLLLRTSEVVRLQVPLVGSAARRKLGP